MNNLEIINEQEVLGVSFRIYGSPEAPLFLAKDVASWIDHSDTSKMLNSIDEGEKLIRTLFVAGQNRDVWFVTEDGFYEILMLSRKPIAKEFKKQVKEILKSIRKHGMYAMDELIDNPDLAIRALTALKEEREKTKLLQCKVEQDQPLVLFAESVASSKDSVLIHDLATVLTQNGVKNMGEIKLFLDGFEIMDICVNQAKIIIYQQLEVCN